MVFRRRASQAGSSTAAHGAGGHQRREVQRVGSIRRLQTIGQRARDGQVWTGGVSRNEVASVVACWSGPPCRPQSRDRFTMTVIDRGAAQIWPPLQVYGEVKAAR